MTTARTSDTHPLRVDFVDAEALNMPGRLGLTFAPGKKQPYAQTGSWTRDLETDLRALRDEFGADLLVSLIEEHEFERLQIPTLRERAPLFGMEVLWFPIRDQSVPESLQQFHEAVGRIVGYLRRGKTVVVHCMGGLGRTGLVAAACLLALTELSPSEAMAAVRRARAGAVETAEQEEYLVTFHRHLRRVGQDEKLR
jgi:protein-tyrosine phosphatase